MLFCLTGLLSKASPCVELAIGTSWRYSTEINKDAGNNTSWTSKISCKITNTQLRRDPIKIKVLDSGKVIGQGEATALPLFAKSSEFTKLKCELAHNGQPAGAVILTAKFLANHDTNVEEKNAAAGPRGDMRVASDKEKAQQNSVFL